MDKRLKLKAVLIGLGIAMVLPLTGCNMTKTKETGATEKAVTLKWVIAGPARQTDADRVWEEFNKRLQKFLPNTTIDFVQIPIQDFQEKWKLMVASGEQMDIAWNGFTNPYIDEVKKGAFLPLNELIDKYAPDIKKEIPDWALQKNMYQGDIYAVPNMQMMTKMFYGLHTTKEHADKYLDRNKLQKAFSENKTNTIACYQVLEEYLQSLKDNNVLGRGASRTLAYMWYRGYEDVYGQMVFLKISDNDYKVYSAIDLPEFDLFSDVMRKWFEKGLINKEVISQQTPAEFDGKNGGSAIWIQNGYKGEAERESINAGFKVDVIPLEDQTYIKYEAVGGTALPRTCKDQERAIKLVDLMQTEKGKDLYNLLVYGFEGEHYKVLEGQRIETIGYAYQGQDDSKYGLWKWVLGNTFNAAETTADPVGWNNYVRNELNGKAKKSILSGFSLDTDPIQVEISQCNAVMKEYESIMTGAVPEYKQLIVQRNEKLKKAGIDKIVSEMQKQINDWVAKNKK